MKSASPMITVTGPGNRASAGRKLARSASALSVCATTAVAGVYKPRRAQASPLFRLVSDHFRAFHAAYEDRFAATYGDWRPVVREVTDKFFECGVLEHGFARVRCDACAHEYAPGVPHRQVVLTIPKRLRAWCLYGAVRHHVRGPVVGQSLQRDGGPCAIPRKPGREGPIVFLADISARSCALSVSP
jgi:hypothetical protein